MKAEMEQDGRDLCTDKYRKDRCKKTCTKQGSDMYGSRVYTYRLRIKMEETKYASRCEYQKAIGGCHIYTIRQGDCRGTCNTCSECKDAPWLSFPMSDIVYKRKTFSSRCAMYKSQGMCAQWYGSRCKKTCTGSGTDSYPAQTTSGYETTHVDYPSRCNFVNTTNYRGGCSYHYHKYACKKTCTGEGSDRSDWSQPYKYLKRVVESNTTYVSRCAYYKKKGQCGSSGYGNGRYCQKTCGTCQTNNNLA